MRKRFTTSLEDNKAVRQAECKLLAVADILEYLNTDGPNVHQGNLRLVDKTTKIPPHMTSGLQNQLIIK